MKQTKRKTTTSDEPQKSNFVSILIRLKEGLTNSPHLFLKQLKQCITKSPLTLTLNSLLFQTRSTITSERLFKSQQQKQSVHSTRDTKFHLFSQRRCTKDWIQNISQRITGLVCLVSNTHTPLVFMPHSNCSYICTFGWLASRITFT